MQFSGFTHKQFAEFFNEKVDAADDPEMFEQIKAKHQELGVLEVLDNAFDVWLHFFETFQIIKMTEMHLYYEANSYDLDEQLGERQRQMVGSKILDQWHDDSKALSAIHACQVASGRSEELFTPEQLILFMHKCTLRMRANEGGFGFGNN